MKHHLFIFFLVVIVTQIYVPDVDARAFCALRDPIKTIRMLFPESDQHRSIVKAINSDIRNKISDSLPFTLHFNELGKHTLYVAENNQQPVGFVHVRSELTKWGLVEIAWALNPDLSIRNVEFQRCRIPDCNGQYLTDVLKFTVGKSFSQIRSLVSKDGKALSMQLGDNHIETSAFILATLKSALKTIVVTSVAWQKEVADINRRLLLEETFGQVQHLSLKPVIISDKRIEQLDKQIGGSSMIDRSSIEAFQIINDKNNVGTIISATWRDGHYQGMFNWLIDAEGIIKDIRPIPAWRDAEMKESFAEIQGQAFHNSEQCHTAVQLMGFELYFLSHHYQ